MFVSYIRCDCGHEGTFTYLDINTEIDTTKCNLCILEEQEYFDELESFMITEMDCGS